MKNKQVIQFIVGSILLLTFLGTLTFYLNKEDKKRKDEKKWFAANLPYTFCCEIIEITELKQKWGYGIVLCKLDDPILLNTSIEDSLQVYLKHHKKLRFVWSRTIGEVEFLIPAASSAEKKDRICIDSEKNTVVWYRKDSLLSEGELEFYLYDEWFD